MSFITGKEAQKTLSVKWNSEYRTPSAWCLPPTARPPPSLEQWGFVESRKMMCVWRSSYYLFKKNTEPISSSPRQGTNGCPPPLRSFHFLICPSKIVLKHWNCGWLTSESIIEDISSPKPPFPPLPPCFVLSFQLWSSRGLRQWS